MNNDHQRPERIRSDRNKALLTLRGVILQRERQSVIQYPVAFGKRHAMFLYVCRIFFRVEFGGHADTICTLCISVNMNLD